MRESTFWNFFMMAGILLLVFLGFHMFYLHLAPFFGMNYESLLEFTQVKLRAHSTFFFILYLVLLLLALYHGLYGLRTILIEAGLKGKSEKIVTTLIVLFGLFLFSYGTYILVAALGI